MRVLAFDISTRTGWGFFLHREDPVPEFGTIKLPKSSDMGDIGARTVPLRLEVRALIKRFTPDAVGFEAPWLPIETDDAKPSGYVTSAAVVRLLVCLAGEVETTARECGVGRVIECATSSCKVALVGFGRAPQRKPGEKKFDWGRAMLIAATRRGWRVGNDNEADAGAVGLVTYDHLEG